MKREMGVMISGKLTWIMDRRGKTSGEIDRCSHFMIPAQTPGGTAGSG
jgi:hypothetical protein